MGLVGISEYTLMEFYAIREPYVRRLLIKRSAGILVLTVAIGPCSPPPGAPLFSFPRCVALTARSSRGPGLPLHICPR